MTIGKKIPITVLVQTKNEEVGIAACLAGLTAFDEVIVVDSNSTDRTKELALAAGAKVVNFTWNGEYPKKKQWQLDNIETLNQWVLFIDADETPRDALIAELATIFAGVEPTFAAFDIDLDYVFAGRVLRHGHRVTKRCLVKRGYVSFPVMDDLEAPGMGELEGHYQPAVRGIVKRLEGRILHNDLDPVSSWFARHNKYSDWEAHLRTRRSARVQVRGSRTPKGRVFDAVPLKPAAFFAYAYVAKAGFLDGRAGLDYAIALATYYWQIEVKTRESLRMSRAAATSAASRPNAVDNRHRKAKRGTPLPRTIVVQHPHDGEISGVSTYVDNLERALSARGVAVRVVSTKADSFRQRVKALQGADHLHLTSHDLALVVAARLAGLSISLKYHWPFWLSTKTNYVAMRPFDRLLAEVRYLWAAAGGLRNVRGILRGYLRLMARLVVRALIPTLMACSEFTARALDYSRPVTAVPNPFYFADGLAPQVRDKPTFVYVGRLAKDKGVDLAVRAAASLREEGYAFELEIVGDGPERQVLEMMVSELQIEDSVHFAGRLAPDEMLARVASAVALVYPARWEDPAPYPPLEAASRSVMTIGARVGGLPETAGPHALLFEPESVDGLLLHMRWVLDNPGEAGLRGINARESAIAKYSADKATGAFLAAISGEHLDS